MELFAEIWAYRIAALEAYETDKLRRLHAASADTPKAKFARFARD